MAEQPASEIGGPEEQPIRRALSEVLGSRPIDREARVFGGSSGASLLRVDAGDMRLLVRAEGPTTPLLKRNPHRFIAMKLSAEAGVAPRVHYIDETSGVTVTDFIEHRPLAEFSGGPVSLARALGDLLRRLQAQAPFPPLVDYRDLLGDMLGHLAGLFRKGLLDAHAAELTRLRASLEWDPEGSVASHNDPNPNNIVFDGDRLWLIDWEAGYRNDPMVDVGIVADTFAGTGELEEALLSAWLGAPPAKPLRERFAKVRRLTRLYYACFLLHAGAGARVRSLGDLRALTPAELLERLATGQLQRGSRETAFEFGKVYLEAFLTGVVPPGMREAGAAAF